MINDPQNQEMCEIATRSQREAGIALAIDKIVYGSEYGDGSTFVHHELGERVDILNQIYVLADRVANKSGHNSLEPSACGIDIIVSLGELLREKAIDLAEENNYFIEEQ